MPLGDLGGGPDGGLPGVASLRRVAILYTLDTLDGGPTGLGKISPNCTVWRLRELWRLREFWTLCALWRVWMAAGRQGRAGR
jgi:hypothetical protein